MKNLTKLTLVVLTFICISGCTKNETEKPNFETVVISVDKTLLISDGIDECLVTATDGKGTNITDLCAITVNNEPLASIKFSTSNEGTYVIKATYNNVRSNAVTIEARPKYRFTIDKTELMADDKDRVVLRIRNYKNEDKTESAVITINNQVSSGNEFKTLIAGSYQIKAVIDGHTFNVAVEAKNDISFTGRVLIEDYTGTWCGYCPRVATKIEEAKHLNKDVLSIGIHGGDEMETVYSKTFNNKFGITGYPTAILNRSQNNRWDEVYNSLLPMITTNIPIGIAIESTNTNGTASASIIIRFKDANQKNLKLAAYLIEDNVAADQVNYYNDGRGNPIVNYLHQDVLREKMCTELMGDVISPEQIIAGETITYIRSVPLKAAWKSKDCKVIVLVTNGTNDQLIAVQEVELGRNIGY
jgi:thiol-disulfide isomerase/thioredoxin